MYDEIEEMAVSYLNVYQLRQIKLIGQITLALWRKYKFKKLRS